VYGKSAAIDWRAIVSALAGELRAIAEGETQAMS